MIKIINFIYRGFRSIAQRVWNVISNNLAYVLMRVNSVKPGSGFTSKGVPKLMIHHNSNFLVGNNFKINNTIAGNPIGRNYKCIFRVNKDALLKIGDNVGMSGTAIVCHKEIIISDNVKIGGNTCIYDTDFHSLDANDRRQRELDIRNTKKKKVFIGENVFIGAHVTILKGVTIGENSIIGACSVVSKNVPENEIWAGNPAKFIKKINEEFNKNY
jgi:acetyltransferase-like isoleucine patch superfamily enzyme